MLIKKKKAHLNVAFALAWYDEFLSLIFSATDSNVQLLDDRMKFFGKSRPTICSFGKSATEDRIAL
jgi:hypothetical protein